MSSTTAARDALAGQLDARPGLGWSPAGVLAVVLAWAGFKALSAWWWVLRPGEFSDTYYYFLAAEHAVATDTLTQALPEYPTPAAWLLLAPYLLGSDDPVSYRGAIMAMTTLADAALALTLGRIAGPIGVLGWIGLTTALGSLPLLRFDMLPAAVAGIALLLVLRARPTAAGVLIALGTALKVWPIVLAPLLLTRARRDGTRGVRARGADLLRWGSGIVALGVGGVGLVIGSVAVAGWERLFSPLAHQGERGLQIEAVAATVPMWSWARGGDLGIGYREFHAYEIDGPGVQGWLTFAQLASWVALAGCVLLLGRWLRRGAAPTSVGWLALVLIGSFICTSPALSPQYLLWLAPPAAVLLGMADRREPDAPPWRPAAFTWAGALLLCLLTTVIYPIAYDSLLTHRSTTTAAIAILTVRNLGLLVFVTGCAESAWSAVGGNQRKQVLGNNRSS